MNSKNAIRCPFCGKVDVLIKLGHNQIIFILCGAKDDGSDGCGAVTSFRGPHIFSATEAVKKWRRRT